MVMGLRFRHLCWTLTRAGARTRVRAEATAGRARVKWGAGLSRRRRDAGGCGATPPDGGDGGGGGGEDGGSG